MNMVLFVNLNIFKFESPNGWTQSPKFIQCKTVMRDHLERLLIKLEETEVAVVLLRTSMQLKSWETLTYLKHHHSTPPPEHASICLVAHFLRCTHYHVSVCKFLWGRNSKHLRIRKRMWRQKCKEIRKLDSILPVESLWKSSFSVL